MKGRPLVETPINGEAAEDAEEDGFVGFQRHGMTVNAAPVLGSSPTAPESAC